VRERKEGEKRRMEGGEEGREGGREGVGKILVKSRFAFAGK
jgi:hypothetical protein